MCLSAYGAVVPEIGESTISCRARAQRSGARACHRSEALLITLATIVSILTHDSLQVNRVGNDPVLSRIQIDDEHEHRPSG